MQGEMDKLPFVSVIIPTYKPGEYLWQCLQSLDKQSLAKDKFEVIIILNGCYQPFKLQLDGYIKKLTSLKIKFFQTDVGGVSNARNIGLDMSVGEYITFMDDDDFVSPTYLEELLQIADTETIGVSNELKYIEKDDSTQSESYTHEYNKKSPQGKQRYSNSRKVFSAPWMKMIHRDIIAANKFDTRYTNGEDSLFMFQISCNVKYVNFTSPDAIYYRRVREGSAMSKERGPQKMLKNRLKMIAEFIRIYLQCPKKYNFWFLCTRILGCLHSIFNSFKHLF